MYLQLQEQQIIFVDEFGISCSHRSKYGRSATSAASATTIVTKTIEFQLQCVKID